MNSHQVSNQHPDQESEHYKDPKSSLGYFPLSNYPSNIILTSNFTDSFCLFSKLFQMKSYILQSFCVWFPSFDFVFLRFIHTVTCHCSLFFLNAVWFSIVKVLPLMYIWVLIFGYY